MGPYVGHTAAYLEGADLIDTPHITAFLQYRKRKGNYADGLENRLKVELMVGAEP